MNYYENQQKEIATIKPRTFKLKLSDADVIRIFEFAAKSSITPEELLENFIGDLVYGTYTNGSDERIAANEWYDRCGFCVGSNSSFLKYIIEFDYIEQVMELLNDIDNANDEMKLLIVTLACAAIFAKKYCTKSKSAEGKSSAKARDIARLEAAKSGKSKKKDKADNIRELGDEWALDYDIYDNETEEYTHCGGYYESAEFPSFEMFISDIEANVRTAFEAREHESKQQDEQKQQFVFMVEQYGETAFFRNDEMTVERLKRECVSAEKPFLYCINNGSRISGITFAEISQS
ncbi:MAG: hypothetical protein J6A05_10800, partial [Oscillospiraceae bacterium]|nr:hypothetical protein [Oscillospiraceae bacterium]